MCSPVMAKKVAPNSGTPHSLPKAVTCSWLIRFIHSVRCNPTKVAPAAMVARIQRAAAARFPWFMAWTAITMVRLLVSSAKVITLEKRSEEHTSELQSLPTPLSSDVGGENPARGRRAVSLVHGVDGHHHGETAGEQREGHYAGEDDARRKVERRGPVRIGDAAVGIGEQQGGKRQRVGDDEQPHPELLRVGEIRRAASLPERAGGGGSDVGRHPFQLPPNVK